MVLRVEAYLRIACSVLGFDIGELWCARKISGYAPTLRFIQLYSSPTYEDFHSTLVHPEGSGTSTSDDSKHRFSPIICRGVCDGGQIVWANTRISNGFIGCTDLPLNTAVGLPVCSVGDDLCILVLYSVPVMHISPNAVEFLCSITRAASEGEGGFLPNTAANPVSPAMTEQFVGVWDMAVFISKYAKDVDFQLLPLNQLQGYIDFQERVAFKELFEDFKQSRDGKFTTKQIQSLRFRGNDELDSLCGSEISYTSDEKDDRVGPGAFTVDFEDSLSNVGRSVDNDKDDTASVGSSSILSSNNVLKHASSSSSLSWYNSLKSGDEIAQSKTTSIGYAPVDARYSYKKHRERFHEFMVAALGMTIFDAAELWLLSDRTDELNVVAALHRDGDMQILTSQSKDIRLSRGQDVPGKVLVGDYPIWDHNYDNHKDEAEQYPRACAAAEIGVRTAFGVPLPGPSGSVGVLMLYSKKEVGTEPLVVTLVLKAAQLLSASALGVGALTKLDIENIIHTPKSTLSDWLHQNQTIDTGNRVSFPIPTLAGIQQKFSSESFSLSPTTSFYQNNETTNDISNSYGSGLIAGGPPFDRPIDNYIMSPAPVLSHNNNLLGNTRHVINNNHDDVMNEAIALQQLKYVGMNTNMNQASVEYPSSSSLSFQQPPPVSALPVMKEEAIGGPITEEHIRIYNWMKQQIEGGGVAVPGITNNNNNNNASSISSNQRNITSGTTMEEMIAQNAVQLPATTHYVSDMLQGGIVGSNSRSPYHQSSLNDYQNYYMNQPNGNFNHLPNGVGMSNHNHSHNQRGMQYVNQQAMPVLIGSTKRMSSAIDDNYAKTGNVRWYQTAHQHDGGGGVGIGNDNNMMNDDKLLRGNRGIPGRSVGMFGSGVTVEGSSYGYGLQSTHGGGYYGNDFTPTYVEVEMSAAENARSANLRQQNKSLPNTSNFNRAPNVLASNPPPQDSPGYFLGSGISSNTTTNNNSDGNGAITNDYEGSSESHNLDQEYCHEIDDKPKVCKLEGCTNLASKRSPYCSNHTGTRRCQWESCGKCAQGSTKFCISHGGGRRCTFQGCSKGARDKFFCAAHGGGKRCRVGDCTKSAVGGSKLCTAHGGGKRCQSFGCSKSAQSSTPFCVRHGGGRKCHIGGCSKVARGKTDFCAAHGGGMKCRAESCVKAAAGRYFYCKEHLKIFGGAEEDFDDIEDDELYSGADHGGGGGDGGTSDTESLLGKRSHHEDDDETVTSKKMEQKLDDM